MWKVEDGRIADQMHSCTFGLNANVMRYVFALQILFINSEKLLCDSNVGLFDVHSIATFFGLIVWVTHANFHYVSQIFSFSCWLWTGLLNSLLSCRASHIFHSLALSHSSNSTLLTRICGALCYVQSEAGSFNSFESFFFLHGFFFPTGVLYRLLYESRTRKYHNPITFADAFFFLVVLFWLSLLGCRSQHRWLGLASTEHTFAHLPYARRKPSATHALLFY